MLDMQMLKAMPNGTVFATGTAMDNPDGLHMAGTGKELRWIAISGSVYHDWAIYCHFIKTSFRDIKAFGNKVGDKEHIRKLVPCDDEAFRMYRR